MDPVQTAVISSRFDAVVKSMTNTIFRSGRSGVLNSAHDFSCCIVTNRDELLIGAESLPIHMMSGPDLIAKAIRRHHPHVRRGDAFIHNSPYDGNSHAADHTLFAPVVDDAGIHRFSVLAKAHQADCGDSEPTTYMGGATDVYNEGALIFDAFRVEEDYVTREDFVRQCRLRIRVPDQWWGDYLSLLGALRVGERRILELGEQLGWEQLDEFVETWFDYSEVSMRETIAKLPSGRVSAVSVHDPYPGSPDGIPIKATVDVDSERGRINVDLTENPACQPNGLNLTEATSRTAAMIGIFNGIGSGVPPNAGSFRRISVDLRENCVAGIPRHPASCSVATSNVADRVANAVGRALAGLGDGIGVAECGSTIPAGLSVVSGRDPKTGEPFMNQFFLAATAGAGAPQADGWITMAHVGAAGVLRRDSIEFCELRFPLRVRALRLLPDTGGAGRQRGAPSAYLEFGPVGTTMHIAYGCDGEQHPALGAAGGLAGRAAEHSMRSREGSLTRLPAVALAELEDGETIISITPAGGGYGPPAERDPRRVAHDVREGYVSADEATAVYRVALTATLEVDEEGTARLRAPEEPPA